MADVSTTVILRAILSYPHLDVPQAGQDPNKDKAKYSGAFVITKEEQATPRFAAAVAAARAAAVAKFGDKAPAIPIIGGKGAAIRNDMAGKGYPEGSVVINARNESQPGMVYAHPDPKNPTKPERIPQDKIKELFYPGVAVNVQLQFYGYNKATNKGVTASLQNLQLIGGGERLDNRQSAEDVAEFAASMNETPAGLEELVG